MRARDALRAAARRLEEAGVPDPVRDARRLMDHFFGRLWDDDPVPDEDAYDRAVARRAAREPISHITGLRGFWRSEFRVTPDVLDPRPETEALVEAALEWQFNRVLDIGTGSGVILLTLLVERAEARGFGTDVSEAALAVARRNAEGLGVEDRATWHLTSWTAGVPGVFDLIVSNPPYLAEHEMEGLAPELSYEPRGALTLGGDGLDAYRAIAAEAPDRMAPGGRILLEIGPTQGEAVSGMLRDAGLTRVEIRRDLDGRDRVVMGEKLRIRGDSGL